MSTKLFDIDNIKINSNIFIVGYKNTGKTTLIKKIINIIKSNHNSKGVHLAQNNIGHLIIDKYPIHIYNKNRLFDIISEKINEYLKNYNISNYLAIDNIIRINIPSIEWQKQQSFKDMMLGMGKINKVTFLLSIENLLYIDNTSRKDADYIFFASGDLSITGPKMIFDIYVFSYFLTFAQFKNFYNSLKKYDFLVIKTTYPSNYFVYNTFNDTNCNIIEQDILDDKYEIIINI